MTREERARKREFENRHYKRLFCGAVLTIAATVVVDIMGNAARGYEAVGNEIFVIPFTCLIYYMVKICEEAKKND